MLLFAAGSEERVPFSVTLFRRGIYLTLESSIFDPPPEVLSHFSVLKEQVIYFLDLSLGEEQLHLISHKGINLFEEPGLFLFTTSLEMG